MTLTKKNSTPEMPIVGQNFPRYCKGYLGFFTELRNNYLFIYFTISRGTTTDFSAERFFGRH